MKREIYTFNGKDYENNQVVHFTFCVHKNCIENFLKIIGSNKYQNKKRLTFSTMQTINSTSCSFKGKVIFGCYLAFHLYRILKELGVHDSDEVRDNFIVYQHKLYKK